MRSALPRALLFLSLLGALVLVACPAPPPPGHGPGWRPQQRDLKKILDGAKVYYEAQAERAAKGLGPVAQFPASVELTPGRLGCSLSRADWEHPTFLALAIGGGSGSGIQFQVISSGEGARASLFARAVSRPSCRSPFRVTEVALSVKDGKVVIAPRWDREVARLSDLVPSAEITDLDRCKAYGFVPLRSPTGAILYHATGVPRPDPAKSCPAIWRAACARDATFRAEHPEGCQRAAQAGS